MCAGMARTARWAGEPSATQALFEVVDPDLERGDVLLQLLETALQHLAAQFGDLASHPGDLLVDAVEPAAHLGETPVGLGESPVDLGELASEELDKLLVFRR